MPQASFDLGAKPKDTKGQGIKDPMDQLIGWNPLSKVYYRPIEAAIRWARLWKEERKSGCPSDTEACLSPANFRSGLPFDWQSSAYWTLSATANSPMESMVSRRRRTPHRPPAPHYSSRSVEIVDEALLPRPSAEVPV